MDDELVGYEHPRLGFRVPLPSGWERVVDPMDAVALLSVEPERDGGWFRANVVVTVEDVPPGLDLAGWQAATEDLAPRLLSDYLLIDREFVQRGDRTLLRRLAHHTTDRGSVTAEQWSLLVEHTVYALTASVATLECAETADLFAAIADGFRPAVPVDR